MHSVEWSPCQYCSSNQIPFVRVMPLNYQIISATDKWLWMLWLQLNWGLNEMEKSCIALGGVVRPSVPGYGISTNFHLRGPVFLGVCFFTLLPKIVLKRIRNPCYKAYISNKNKRYHRPLIQWRVSIKVARPLLSSPPLRGRGWILQHQIKFQKTNEDNYLHPHLPWDPVDTKPHIRRLMFLHTHTHSHWL